MAVEAGVRPQDEFGSLQGCFVEGSAEQRGRERRIRRRALAVSVAMQTAILTVVLLVPLFAKPERLNYNILTPIPPYAPARSAERVEHPTRPRPPRRNLNPRDPYAAPTRIPPHFDPTPDPQPETPGILPGPGPATPCIGCIPIDDDRIQPERPPDVQPKTPKRIVVTHLEPAMLIHRIEPPYPTLAIQTRREGKVELRAIIATDGTIKSLQVVSGDALFLRSALDAVGQWRYRPTILNGQPVEIDTFITVVYSLQH